MNIIRTRSIWFTFSSLLFLLSGISFLIWGFKLGIDFTGGSLVEVHFSTQRPEAQVVKEKIETTADLGTVSVQPLGQQDIIIRLKFLTETEHQTLLGSVREIMVDGQTVELEERRFETVGPTVSEELKSKSFFAITFVLIGIVLYVAWAFRTVSRPVHSVYYGVATIIALLHDVVIPSGVFIVLGRFFGVEIDTLFITALLVILGFSVHDTIVVFDRIRENVTRFPREEFSSVVNKSIIQTITRSITTSLTVVLSLFPVLFFGGESIHNFVLALIIGIVIGTYSSICIASPLLVVWERHLRKRI